MGAAGLATYGVLGVGPRRPGEGAVIRCRSLGEVGADLDRSLHCIGVTSGSSGHHQMSFSLKSTGKS